MKSPNFARSEGLSFDLTPFIDVIFLLIIFFMLVCQFFVAEQFDVALPKPITSAEEADLFGQKTAVVTVMQKEGEILYAVGSDIMRNQDPELLERMITAAINSRLMEIQDNQIVYFRCDKEITFECVKPALSGISHSMAQQVHWAAYKE